MYQRVCCKHWPSWASVGRAVSKNVIVTTSTVSYLTTTGNNAVCTRLGWRSLIVKSVVNKYWKTLQGAFDKGWYDMRPVSRVNALKYGQTNNLTMFGTNIGMPVVLMRCQNQHSFWITGKLALNLRNSSFICPEIVLSVLHTHTHTQADKTLILQLNLQIFRPFY